MKKVLVTGAEGQIGWELLRTLQPLGRVIGWGRTQLDLRDHRAIRRQLSALRPDVIVNAAAQTGVDAAENDEASARMVNADAVAVLAECASALDALLVHYSTDHVFAGDKTGEYDEDDAASPINAYGRTKLLGEKALCASAADWVCLRTSWIYAARGTNFVRTILRLALEREELTVVSDQIGAPTSARLVAETTAHVIAASLQERNERRFRPQTFHLSAAGSTSRHGFAQAIVALAKDSALRNRLAVKTVRAIRSSDWPAPARRPGNSRLRCRRIEERFGLQMPAWEDGVTLCLEEILSGAPPL